MTSLFIRLFIKNGENLQEPETRFRYGKLAGATGLSANLLLFLMKILSGLLAGSMAVIADAFNNLSDAGSSVVTLVGFKLSSRPADSQHPFGHGRMEYLSTLAVAALIMAAGFELCTSSFEKILHPTQTAISWITLVILAISIAVKLWMACFYRRIGRMIESDTLKASAADSRNDVVCTSVVFLSALFSLFSDWQIDGYVGLAVALFVLWSGFSLIREAVSPLLGQAPDPQMVQEIRERVLAHEGVVGMHDLIIHNYGPGRMVISLHAEVPCEEDMMRSHDRIDCVERELSSHFHANVCIHMDPVDTQNERSRELKTMVEQVLSQLDPRLSFHDFRVVLGETHTNLIFDLVVPFQYPDERGLASELERRLQQRDPTLYVVATVEHSCS